MRAYAGELDDGADHARTESALVAGGDVEGGHGGGVLFRLVVRWQGG